MKNILLLLICLSFFGCTTTFKASNGEDGKPGENGKPGTEQKGEDGEDGKNGENKSRTIGLKP